MRLDCLLCQPLLYSTLHVDGRSGANWDEPGERHADPATTCSVIATLREPGETPAIAEVPNSPPPAASQIVIEIVSPTPILAFDDAVIDIHDIVADPVVLEPLIDDFTGSRPGGRQVRAC